MKYLKIIMTGIFITLMTFSLSYGSDTDQEKEIAMLRQRIIELETKIKDMETIIAKCNEQDKALDESGYGWQNKKNWRKLSQGMSTDEVLAILGDPIKTIDGVKTLWYYPDIYRGYVTFDNQGRLTGWNEP